jgi:anti-sigma B factor antagonist
VVAPLSPIGSQPVTPLAVSVDLPSAQVQVTGALDRESSHHLVDAMAMLTARSSRLWRLDASGVTFCDVGGLRALSDAHALATSHGRSLQLVRTSRPVDRLVELLGHDRVFPAQTSRRPGGAPTRRQRLRCATTRTV